jgi:hypothetical protein
MLSGIFIDWPKLLILNMITRSAGTNNMIFILDKSNLSGDRMNVIYY